MNTLKRLYKLPLNGAPVNDFKSDASLLKITVLLAAVVSNPVPAIVIVVALIARLLELNVTVGAATMVAT